MLRVPGNDVHPFETGPDRFTDVPSIEYQVPFWWGSLQVARAACLGYDLRDPQVPVEDSTLADNTNRRFKAGLWPRINVILPGPRNAQQFVDALAPGTGLEMRDTFLSLNRPH